MIFIWVKPDTGTRRGLEARGFTVLRGKGSEEGFYIQSRDSLLDPTAKMRAIRRTETVQVTVRADMQCQLPLGCYRVPTKSEMYVKEVIVEQDTQRGLYKVCEKVPSTTHRHVRIRANNLNDALSIVQMALDGTIQPDPSITDAVMDAVG